MALSFQPYFAKDALPTSLYLKTTILPQIYEGLLQVEKLRPKDPIEFFCAFILEKNKKEIY